LKPDPRQRQPRKQDAARDDAELCFFGQGNAAHGDPERSHAEDPRASL